MPRYKSILHGRGLVEGGGDHRQSGEGPRALGASSVL